MNQTKQPSENQVAVIERFTTVCQQDERVVAAFLGGSYAKGTADAYSDLDLYVILKDSEYDDLLADLEPFVTKLGESVFLERWDEIGFPLLLFVFTDGTEGEIAIGRASDFKILHGGPFEILVDKAGILSGVTFPSYQVPKDEQLEKLHSLIYWFWHDLLHHFITPMARGYLWSAYGALEDLRRTCINLARLQENFDAPADAYEKVEQTVPTEILVPLQNSFVPLERGAMLKAAKEIVRYYQSLAPKLAKEHGIAYPTELERLMMERLEKPY